MVWDSALIIKEERITRERGKDQNDMIWDI
jgi:hypothetical protein